MLTAAIYARYSTDDQRATSIEDQVARCVKAAAREGLTVEEALIFTDSAQSGLDKGKIQRKNYLRLLDAVESRICAVVIADEISRLTREVEEGGRLMKLVDKWGLRVITCDGIDTTKPEWRTIWLAKLMTARIEVETTGERTKRGMLGQLGRGYMIAAAPFGYTQMREFGPGGRILGTQWAIDEQQAKIVRQIFDWKYSGLSLVRIARTLQDAGVTPPGAGRTNAATYWRPGTVFRILSNAIYRGEFIWHGSSVTKTKARRLRKTIPEERFPRPQLRLVTDELWYACNRSGLEENSQYRAPRGGGKHLLGGMIRCGLCHALCCIGSGHPVTSFTLYCPQCESAFRAGGRDSWMGYSSNAAAKEALYWVLERVFTGDVKAEFHRRLAEKVTEGPALEERRLRERLSVLEATSLRLKHLMLTLSNGPDEFKPDFENNSREMDAVRRALEAIREGRRQLTPDALARQLDVDPLSILRGLLDGNEEVYKVRATLRRLFRLFEFSARPCSGKSVFTFKLRPGVCVAELTDTPIIDHTEVGFEVTVSTTKRRPVEWAVSGRALDVE